VQKINAVRLPIVIYGRNKPLRAKQGATHRYTDLDVMWEVVAANVAPKPRPPFLKHIPEFRRMAIPIKQDAAKKFSFEVQDDVLCKGCVEP